MSNAVCAPPLKAGDKIAIVSTARSITPEKVEPAIAIFKSWGLKVVLGPNIYSIEDQFAGPDSARASDLQQMVNDPSIRAIICSRGGYGSVRIVDQIDWTRMVENPKWLVGYSDVTAIHMDLLAHSGLASIHATMPVNMGSDLNDPQEQSVSSLRTLLFGQPAHYQLNRAVLSRPGNCSGPLIGGNLSMLYSLLGSRSIPDFRGAILFLEDLDEYLYHIDRMLMNLKRNGVFEGLAGLIVGGLTDMNDNAIPFGKAADEIVWDHVSSFDFPVYFNFGIGHQDLNLALAQGVPARIESDILHLGILA